VSGLNIGTSRFAADDGAAEPRAAAALAAFAAGQASEHDAVQALSRTRMLVPVVAAEVTGDPAEEGGGEPAGASQASAAGASQASAPGAPQASAAGASQASAAGASQASAAGASQASAAGAYRAGAPQVSAGAAHRASAAGAHRASEMSIPTLVGQDGRRAVLAFTSVAALARWRADARPVPTEAIDVWRAAVADGSAVVVDIAGPVPLAIDGARLSALALGEPVPPVYQDPDVLAAVRAAGVAQPGVTAISLAAGPDGSDLAIRLKLAAGLSDDQRQQAANVLAEAVLAGLGGRLRRGIAVVIDPDG
jgi:SseB protein N-terminal domain